MAFSLLFLPAGELFQLLTQGICPSYHAALEFLDEDCLEDGDEVKI